MTLSNRPRVLITGAQGFVGKHLCDYLMQQGFFVKAIGRKDKAEFSSSHFEYQQLKNIDSTTDWKDLLHGIDVVIHLAARVHQLKERGMQSLPLYQEINVRGTQQLARAAIKSNVKRFIYVSTVKINGEKTIEMPFRAEEQPRPQDAYSLSKLQAEQILQEEARRSGMEWVIIRPPLIYGPFVQGNFRRLINLAKTFFPLPLSSIKNLRSLVSIYNLCHFIECCVTHPHANGEIFLVSDDCDVSTPTLIKMLRRGMARRSGLFPFPLSIIKFIGFFSGKRHEVARMIDSLQLNIEKSCRLLNWRPPFTVEQSIAALYSAEQPQEERVETAMPVGQQS